MERERLDSFLFSQGFYDSRARAASAIKAGRVIVNGKVQTKSSAKIRGTDDIHAEQEHPWVSRGGMKLDHAIKVFNVDAKKRVCLDIGSSTGGFTEVLLTNGAHVIYAVDVGKAQLHSKLAGHPKIVSMESTDARSLKSTDFETLPDLVVCDASFISAAKVLETSLSIVRRGAELITLVKPQFEVGKENIGKGGIVRNSDMADEALVQFSAWLKGKGWTTLKTTISPITGSDGNIEFLLHARKK